jgi:hypothetical protein
LSLATELEFQNKEKEKRAAELMPIPNLLQNEQKKSKRVINTELQSEE